MRKKRLSDDLTTLIAKQLHAFDYPCGSSETYDDFLNRLSDEAIFKRYRNDALFHNKVCSMVASIFPLLDEHSADLEKEAEFNFEQYQDCGNELHKVCERLSEADKVINMAKSQLEKRRLYACEGSDSYDPECAEQCIDEAIASIEDYEKGK